MLHPLLHRRNRCSLSGVTSQLIAIGGFTNENLRSCETYFTTRNKWSGLPCLNIPRRYPGSSLLQSKIAFCFGGDQGQDGYLNQIETLQTDSDSEWTTLVTDPRIKKTLHLGAVSLFNKIVVFGGREYTYSVTYILSEEGELLSDHSADALIPDGMCFG